MFPSEWVLGLSCRRAMGCDTAMCVPSFVLKQILSGDDRETVVERIHTYLSAVNEEVRNGAIPIAKFVINKGLAKNPEDYADARSQPHVQVALRMKQKGQGIRAGDTVPYVICVEAGADP